jgi:hypothetical protein
MGNANVCDSVKKEAIERQISTTILRSGLRLGFAENPHFQDLVELLCPTYAKCGNVYLGDMLILVIVSSFCLCYYRFLVLGLTCCFIVVVVGGDVVIVAIVNNFNMVVCLLLLFLLVMSLIAMLVSLVLVSLLLLLLLFFFCFFFAYVVHDCVN